MKNAVGYLRVSTNKQARGDGFRRQKAAIRSFSKTAGFRVASWYQESFTGTEADRPVLAQMLEELLATGVSVVLVESLDRLARDLLVQHQILAHFLSKGISVVNASTGQDVSEAMQKDPMLKALVQIQGVFAELEKNLLVGKLRRARENIRKQKGICEGRKPFGHFPGEEEILSRIKQLRRKPRGKPRLGPYQIARILNQEGCPTRTGRQWHGVTVGRILQRG